MSSYDSSDYLDGCMAVYADDLRRHSEDETRHPAHDSIAHAAFRQGDLGMLACRVAGCRNSSMIIFEKDGALTPVESPRAVSRRCAIEQIARLLEA